MLLFSSADIFDGLDPDQDQHSVGPDLGPNCLQMLSADDKSRRQQRKNNKKCYLVLSWQVIGHVKEGLFDFVLNGAARLHSP